jgi:hypothetical protein
MLADELLEGIRAMVATSPSVKRLTVFPHLTIRPMQHRSVESQQKKTPWTTCMTLSIQNLFRDAVCGVAKAMALTAPVTVDVLDASEETEKMSNWPLDGIHYDADEVRRRLLWQLLQVGDTEIIGMRCTNSWITPTLDSVFDGFFRELPNCRIARQRYRTNVLREVIDPALSRFQLAPHGDVNETFAACQIFRFSVWRFWGPEPSWTSDDGSELRKVAAIRSGICNENQIIFLRQSNARIILHEMVSRIGSTACKAVGIILLDFDRSIRHRDDDLWLTPTCMSEPFGGRP